MYITIIKFHRALEWFCKSSYEYLLLYASGSSKLDYEIVEEFFKYKNLIDRQTGSLTCFLHFIEKSEIRSFEDSRILKANHLRGVEDFMLYHVSSEEIREISRKNLYCGFGMEATFETTDELCTYFGIPRYKLPAFILVHKTTKCCSVDDLINSYTIYSIKRKEDYESLLMPIRILNDMTIDLKDIDNRLNSVENELRYEDIIKTVKGLRDGINRLKNEKKEDVFLELQRLLSEMNGVIKEEFGVTDDDLCFENPQNIKRHLLRLGIIKDFMQKYNDKYYHYKSLYNRMLKWNDNKDPFIARQLRDLDTHLVLLEMAKTRESRRAALISERDSIVELYKKKFEESLMVQDASELVSAILSNRSSIPAHLERTVRRYIDRANIVNSTISEIKKKVREKQYDVFISCKSEDYELAENVYDFLIANGYRPFIASKSLRLIAEDKYSPVISEVIDLCKHMIVFASDLLYILTPYVKSEWEMFCNEVKAGRKDGKLITIIENPKLGPQLPIDLRCREVLPISGYQQDICRFLSK